MKLFSAKFADAKSGAVDIVMNEIIITVLFHAGCIGRHRLIQI